MARPREFDETVAVEGAMNAFWARGYEGTSTQDLCAATGLGRSSIYNTFASKRALFERALDHYRARGVRIRGDLLEGPGTAAEKIARLLEDVVEDELEHARRGCLVVNTVAEFGVRDKEITALIDADTAAHLRQLTTCVRAGQADGSLTRDRKPADIAQFVHSTVGGLRLMSRRGESAAAMRAVADIALAAVTAS
ncbi:TetR/AcrR family transcriptional regulator [Amycolatopsis samaneae]|uniref:TetR/AcrR family transcriptional regulator n=1 Tax=Amycolatopsis samaneae TaxID=664691 RepID=A0ABW5GRI2_9PSEU